MCVLSAVGRNLLGEVKAKRDHTHTHTYGETQNIIVRDTWCFDVCHVRDGGMMEERKEESFREDSLKKSCIHPDRPPSFVYYSAIYCTKYTD